MSRWWKDYFDADYLREFEPLFDFEAERLQVARLIELLALPAGSRVLDLACGQGRHAHLLAEAGFDVDGYDLSRDLLKRARARGVAATLRYTRGDMRRLPLRWGRRFDAVVNLFTSFGFFEDPADDARVVRGVARVLKRGGVFVFQAGSRDGLSDRFLAGDSWTNADGTLIEQRRAFDPVTGILSVSSTWTRKRKVERREHHIRLYTATRMAEFMDEAGMTLESAWEGFTDRPLTRRSHEMLLVARKR